MKRPSLKHRSKKGDSSVDDQITEAITDALSSNDKIIEIRPVKRSKGAGLKRLLLLGAGAVGFAYWVRNSQRPKKLIGSVKRKTINRRNQAAETIEEGSEAASERIEEGSEAASERIEEGSEAASHRIEEGSEAASHRIEEGSARAGEAVEEAGKKVADQTEEAGEKAADEADTSTGNSSRL